MGCEKAREFLSRKKIEPQLIDVRKKPVSAAEALKLVRKAKKAYAKKGSKVVVLDLSKKVSNEEILEHFLGRSGTMRAPVVQVGDAIFAGFDEQGYLELLVSS